MTISKEKYAPMIEKIYFDHPRLNSKSQLRDIIDISTGGELDCVELDILVDMFVYRVNNPRVGEIMQIEHNRKEKFVVKLTYVGDEWLRGIIMDGKAGAIMQYNEKFEGEEIDLRRSLCCFYPVKHNIKDGASA